MNDDLDFIDRLGLLWNKWERVPRERALKILRIHLALFAVFVVLLLFILKPFAPESVLNFALPFVWGIAAAIHFFIVMSMNVDEDWVDERTRELQVKSYDFDHIHTIRYREHHGHDSVISPMDPRRKTPAFKNQKTAGKDPQDTDE